MTTKAAFDGGFTSKKTILKDVRTKSKALNPIEKATDMLDKIKALKEAEITRLTKLYMNKDHGDEIKDEVYKIFKYLFGKKEGDHYFSIFMRDKRVRKRRDKK